MLEGGKSISINPKSCSSIDLVFIFVRFLFCLEPNFFNLGSTFRIEILFSNFLIRIPIPNYLHTTAVSRMLLVLYQFNQFIKMISVINVNSLDF